MIGSLKQTVSVGGIDEQQFFGPAVISYAEHARSQIRGGHRTGMPWERVWAGCILSFPRPFSAQIQPAAQVRFIGVTTGHIICGYKVCRNLIGLHKPWLQGMPKSGVLYSHKTVATRYAKIRGTL
jgi:hypothetical protein